MQQTTLDFVQLKGVHSGENIANILYEILNNLGLLNKVF